MKRAAIPAHVLGPLQVAAKAGFLTKRIWADFFATGNRRWQNRRWKYLMETGLFRRVPDYGFVESALTLSDAGKSLAVALGMDPVYSPPARNLWHDEELIRLALFMERQGWVSRWMTEQELKVSGRGQCFFQNQVRAMKIPDLILEWRSATDPVLWAVEFERTRKEHTRYYEFVRAYQGISRIDSVLVIAATPTIEENIKKAQAKTAYSQSERPMIFASLNDLIEDPLSCELRHGPKCIALAKIAHALTHEKPIKSAGQEKGPRPKPGPGWAYLESTCPVEKHQPNPENPTKSRPTPLPLFSPESPVTPPPQPVVREGSRPGECSRSGVGRPEAEPLERTL